MVFAYKVFELIEKKSKEWADKHLEDCDKSSFDYDLFIKCNHSSILWKVVTGTDVYDAIELLFMYDLDSEVGDNFVYANSHSIIEG